MSKKSSAQLTVIALLSCFVMACVQDDGGEVFARDMNSGEIRKFSDGDLPDGWVECPDQDCEVSEVPCEQLGDDLCTTRSDCRLKELFCEAPGGSEPGISTPATCEYLCIPADVQLCSDFASQEQCVTQAGCEWESVSCATTCAPGSDCPPCTGSGSCRAKTASVCQDLSSDQCGQRPDCEWLELPCEADCAPGEGCPPCASSFTGSCQPRKPNSTGRCPDLPAIAPNFCPGGSITPAYDAQGCVVSFECVDVCAAVPMPSGPCQGLWAPQIDAAGCVVSYSCEQDCSDLQEAYRSALLEAQRCDLNSTDTTSTCGTFVDGDLACPICPVAVSSANTAALKQLQQLAQTWKDRGCAAQEIACPAIACSAPTGATCAPTPDAAVGICTPSNN